MKKFLTMFLALTLLTSTIPATSMAKYDEESNPSSKKHAKSLNDEAIEQRNQQRITKKNMGPLDKVNPMLQSLLEGTDSKKNQGIIDVLKKTNAFVTPKEVRSKGLNSASENLVYVYIQLAESAKVNIIDDYLNTIVNQSEETKTLAAWIPISHIPAIASLEEVLFIDLVTPPVVQSITSDGDFIHNADDFRNYTGLSGEGIKIGVISDGVNHWLDARNDGELPDVTVLSDNLTGDEGTALLEIIYDLAPKAELYFHDCGQNTIAFQEAIQSLIDSGCNIIIDDISWPGEPYFEDGSIARYLKKQINRSKNNILYITSAGNAGMSHYQSTFSGDGNNFHDFSPNSGVQSLPIYVPPHGLLQVVLQWDDRFWRSSNDYDLYLFDEMHSLLNIEGGMTIQNGRSNPLEYTYYYNDTSEAQLIYADVYQSCGENKTLELYVFGGYILDYGTSQDSIFGHAAIPEVISVGAINAYNFDGTPNPSLEIASYSSQGNVTIVYPNLEIRNKPDLCGISGISVSGAGGFPSTFYGTSASAPHIAAIAALIWSQSPNKKASQVKKILLGSANDLGDPGRDLLYGEGIADISNAILSPAQPSGLSAEPYDGSVVLNWDANQESDLAYYEISYKLSTATTWKNLKVKAPNTSTNISKLVNGFEYQFRVRAVGKSNYSSGYSDILSVTPLASVPLP